jgi:uncharacterized membrane protein
MEFLLYLVPIIIVFVKIGNLNTRIRSLERGLKNVGKSFDDLGVKKDNASISSNNQFISSVQQNQNTLAPLNALGLPINIINSESEIDDDVSEDSSISPWFSENLLLKLGVLMILIGFGWFISYAFVHNWIGPVGRIMLGFIIGASCALYGTMRFPKSETQGTTFLILGSALVVITSYASQVVYGFFGPMIALAIPFIVSIYVATVGVSYNKVKIAIYAVLIGFLAPLLTHTNYLDINILYFYLFIVTMSCVWVAVSMNWRLINAISILGISLYAFPFVVLGDQNNVFVTTLLYAMALVYFVISIMGIVRSGKDADSSDAFVSILNGAYILGLTLNQINKDLQSLVLAILIMVFAFGAFYVYSRIRKQTFFFMYALVAILYLAVATAIELNGDALIYAFAIEVMAISILTFIITKSDTLSQKLSMLFIIPVVMSLSSFAKYVELGQLVNEQLFIVVFISILMIMLGGFNYFVRRENLTEENNDVQIYSGLIVSGVVYVFILSWYVFHHAILDQDSATVFSLVTYSVIGLITYFTGLFNKKDIIKSLGTGLLVFVVARLVFVDVWSMPLASRIVTFILIGILFISTAFIKKNNPQK